MDLERKIVSERSDGATITWYIVIGDDGAVQFMLMRSKILDSIMPLDVGVHSKEPLYEGDSKDTCDLLGECYFTASHSKAQKILDAFNVSQDPLVIWKELEAIYWIVFQKGM